MSKYLTMMRKLGLFLGTSLLFTTAVSGASIEGPDKIQAGRIASFSADIEGDAILFPAGAADLVKDSGGKRFYIAGNTAGQYTLIFFAVEEGKPAIIQKVFEIQALPKPEPAPEPEPEPDPDPIPDFDLSEIEKDGLIYALQSVCYHIEKGNLKTPAGIRASFKTAIRQKILTETKALSSTLDNLTTRTDWKTAASIKTSFVQFLAELGSPWKGADETFATFSLEDFRQEMNTDLKVKASKTANACPGGTCPPVRYYY